ncbi:MAG: hypothetical protein QNL04_12065 [SAR324 cluster bacterium]|nr:hypothetical protein [SAR324 cluster bacterium]
MLPPKYTRRISVKDLLALGSMFESKGAKFFDQLSHSFVHDPEMKKMVLEFAEEDWMNHKVFRSLISGLKDNQVVFIDEAEYQHMRMLTPEHFFAHDWQHPDKVSPKVALQGVLKFEKGAMAFAKNLLEVKRGYNDTLKPVPEVVEMIKTEEKHIAKVEEFIREHYSIAS